MLKLYNTLTRKKEIFKPIKNKQVGIYTCGPTVYDYAHIGNMRTYIFADILKRYLEYKGYKVKYVMNITDVGHLTSDGDTGEDKIEKGAKREGKTAWEVASFYTKAFLDDTKKLNIEKPDIIPKATEHIKEQIDFIKGLEEKGFTYVISDGVYFDISKLKDYGKLAKLDIKELKPGARIELVEDKKNITDFALWKFTPKGQKRQMEWDSPWGTGFPGWHIECSAMSIKYLGKVFDIHTGAIDHIPIHHTNEIAQAEALLGEPFVNYWMHAEFLLVKGGRMGKSEGNLVTISHLEEEGVAPLAYRLLTLMAHYRDKLNFTDESITAAGITLNNLYYDIRKLQQVENISDAKDISGYLRSAKERFEGYLDDDLNMPRAFSEIFSLLNKIKPILNENKISKKQANQLLILLNQFDQVLGLGFSEVKIEDLSDGEKLLLKEREEARKNKDFKQADRIRDELLKFGIELEDTPQGVRWKRIK